MGVKMSAHKMQQEALKAESLKRALSEQFSDEELAELLPDAIEGETNLLEAIDALALAMTDDEERMLSLGGLIESISARLNRYAARVAKTKAAIHNTMTALDIKKLERPIATFTVAKGSQRVTIDNEEAVPGQYRNNPKPPAPNKTRIKEALKNGDDVPGCSLVTGDPYLKVSRK